MGERLWVINMDIKDILAERLRKCRTEAGLTQIMAATYNDITEKAYQNYELRTSEPKVNTLSRIAQFYKVSMDYLVGLTDDPTPYSKSSDGSQDVLAKRLRKYRKKTGLPQIKVAFPCQVTESAYQGYELAKQEPRLHILVRIAQFYGVPVDYLAGLTDESTLHPEHSK